MTLPAIKNDKAVSESKDDYVIIFNDDSTKRLSKEQADGIMKASGTSSKFFQLHGQLYNFSNIARLITMREYWEQFPDERPQSYDYKKPEYDTGVKRKWTVYDSEKILRKCLEIWKKQKASPNYVRVTGGLDDLIKKGEERLLNFIRGRRKEQTCHARVQLEKYDKTTATRPMDIQQNREARLREIREKRVRGETQIQSVAELF